MSYQYLGILMEKKSILTGPYLHEEIYDIIDESTTALFGGHESLPSKSRQPFESLETVVS